MRETSHEETVRKAVSFMQTNLSRPISIPEIAKTVFYSPDHLRCVFRRITGHGILQYLLSLRVEQARRLLRDTELSVGEIALNTGFNNLPYFSAAFKRMAGISPIQYRIASRRSSKDMQGQASESGSAEVFRDALSGPLSQMWTTGTGEWVADSEYLQGRGSDYFELRCLRRLPENFRISFESFFVDDAGLSPSDLNVTITDQEFGVPHIVIILGAHANTGSKMAKTGRSLMWNPEARIRPGVWQDFSLELKDDRLNLYWDGKQVFSHQDPFPGAYSTRCRAALGSWKSVVRFRNFVIADLGVRPLVQTIRQGDMLFNAGLFDRAREFYLGLLETREASFNSMELHYKLGMCFLRQGLWEQAREWFAKVVTQPENDFWSQAARLAEVETIWEAGDTESFYAKIAIFAATPLFHDGIRELLYRIYLDLTSRGFYRQACRIFEVYIASKEDAFLRIDPQYGLAEALWQLNRFQEEEALLCEMIRGKKSHLTDVYASLNLVDVYSFQGRWVEANATIERIEAITQDQSELALCAVYRARILRGQGKAEEALAMLNSIPLQFPMASPTSVFAKLIACLTYCAIGDSARARSAIEEARKIDPAAGYLSPGEACRFTYVPDLLEKNFEQAADCLMQGGGASRSLSSARYLIYSGIIYELSPNAEMASKAYDRVVRLYPANRYCYYATLAQALQRNDYNVAFDMPYPAQFRSEMFCLLGLLCEAKGRKDEGLEFFRHSMAEDPTMNWPAALSKRKLNGPARS